MRIMVGCPVLHREWILPTWFDHVEAAFVRLEERHPTVVAPHTYVFVGDKEYDPETYAIAKGYGATWVDVVDSRPGDLREWNPKRYERMAFLRNKLLEEVRQQEPDLFLSLDSDVLLHPDALADMVEEMIEGERLPYLGRLAVGGKVYLSQYGVECPSWANIGREGSIRRNDTGATFRVDVIMAVKLMSPAAYRVDYRSDLQGEDIGWSKAAGEAGVALTWTGRSTSKHIFARYLCGDCGHSLWQGRCTQEPKLHDNPVEAISMIDPRVGW